MGCYPHCPCTLSRFFGRLTSRQSCKSTFSRMFPTESSTPTELQEASIIPSRGFPQEGMLVVACEAFATSSLFDFVSARGCTLCSGVG